MTMSTNAQEVHPADTPRRPGEIRIGDVVRLKTGTLPRLVQHATRSKSNGVCTLYTVAENADGKVVRAKVSDAEVEIVQAADPGGPIHDVAPPEEKVEARHPKYASVPSPPPDPDQADAHLHNITIRNGRL